MNRGILQTALINKTLHLELEYGKPSAQWEGEASFANILLSSYPSASEEFANWLSAI